MAIGNEKLNERGREDEFERFFEPYRSSFSEKRARHPSGPQPSPFPELFNLALLACLRYDVRRCLVSLIGPSTQYILAEATRSSSPGSSKSSDPADDLRFGHTAIPLDASLCRFCFGSLSGGISVLPDPKNGGPCLDAASDVQFYAGVPICSDLGYAVGVICIIDDRPRPELSNDSLAFLNSLAASVASNISDARTALEHSRHVRMINGLSTLIRGQTSITEIPRDGSSSSRQLDADGEGQHIFAKHDDLAQSNMLARELKRVEIAAKHETGANLTVPTAEEKLALFEESDSQSRRSSLAPDAHASGIVSLFGRASNIIRESMEVEGAMFLTGSSLRVPDQDSAFALPVPFIGGSERSSANGITSKPSAVLACSTTSMSGVNGDEQRASLRPLSMSALVRLARRYPHGKLFRRSKYEEHSPGSEGEEDMALTPDEMPSPASIGLKRERQRMARQEKEELTNHVLSCAEGAQSVLFLPLRNIQDDKWYAGTLVWTQRKGRIFSPTEHEFLSVFGTNIMAEVAHLSTLATERLKTTFVSTISHELRSPLHGLLGCTDALQDSSLNSFQSDMVQSAKACSVTLLGTIENLLDHAQISNRHEAVQGKKPNTDGVYADLSDITQEVIHSSATGFEASNYDALSREKVRILVDVDYTSSWNFEMLQGAWTRIVLNLVTNSLKFTKHGFVHIRLRSLPPPPGNKDERARLIQLTITDTGKGMSQDFIHNRLYTAFEQEDPQIAGTGIGLSIVKRLVDALGGSIKIKSTRNTGTQVLVEVLALAAPAERQILDGKNNAYRGALACSRGLRVKFLGVCLPSEELVTDGLDSAKLLAQGQMIETQLLTTMCREWFGMEVLDPQDTTLIPDAVIRASDDMSQAARAADPRAAVTIDICNSVRELTDLSRTQHRSHHLIARPVTVGRFAHALNTWVKAIELPSPTVSMSHSSLSDAQELASPTIQEAPQIKQEPTETTKHAGKVPSVLAVDDNPLNLKLLTATLKRLKVEHVSAKNGAEAVDQYRAYRNSLSHILMDISMPVMDGLEATREIRGIEHDGARKPVHIVALTGLASAAAQQEARASGVDLYLTKPIRMEKLREVL